MILTWYIWSNWCHLQILPESRKPLLNAECVRGTCLIETRWDRRHASLAPTPLPIKDTSFPNEKLSNIEVDQKEIHGSIESCILVLPSSVPLNRFPFQCQNQAPSFPSCSIIVHPFPSFSILFYPFPFTSIFCTDWDGLFHRDHCTVK